MSDVHWGWDHSVAPARQATNTLQTQRGATRSPPECSDTAGQICNHIPSTQLIKSEWMKQTVQFKVFSLNWHQTDLTVIQVTARCTNSNLGSNSCLQAQGLEDCCIRPQSYARFFHKMIHFNALPPQRCELGYECRYTQL